MKSGLINKYKEFLNNWFELYKNDISTYSEYVHSLNPIESKEKIILEDLSHKYLKKLLQKKTFFQPYALFYAFSGDIYIKNPIILLMYNPMFSIPSKRSSNTDLPYIKEFENVFKQGFKFKYLWDYWRNRWTYYGEHKPHRAYDTAKIFVSEYLEDDSVTLQQIVAFELIPFYSQNSNFSANALKNDFLKEYYNILDQVLLSMNPRIIVTTNQNSSEFIKNYWKPKEKEFKLVIPKDNSDDTFNRRVLVSVHPQSNKIPVILNFSGISPLFSNLKENEIKKYAKRIKSISKN